MIVSELNIRKAKLEEADLLSNIALESKSYWIYDNDFLEKCKPYLTISIDDIINTSVYVIEDGISIFGFYQLKHINEKEVDLGMFFIKSEYIKKNLGAKLIEQCKSIAKNLGYKFLIIESDPNAKGFYEKQVGIFKGYVKSEVSETRSLPVYEIRL